MNDRSTADFMERLYRDLRGGTGVAEALQGAKRSFGSARARYRDPTRWAPFALVRDPS